MSAYPTFEEQVDVVFQVNWSCIAQDGSTTSGTFGTVPVTYDPSAPYTPYAQLTQEQVWAWINPSIDRTQVELDLAQSIATLQNPTQVTPPLPWGN